MVGMNLLAEARMAGLTVLADGDRLRLAGPKSADPIARKLLDRKADVMVALAAEAVRNLPAVNCPERGPLHALSLAEVEAVVVQLDERAAIRQFDGDLPEAEAERAAVLDLIRSGRLWTPESWAVELRRRADIIGDAATAARFRRAAEVLDKV
jgi:hypothetical protein